MPLADPSGANQPNLIFVQTQLVVPARPDLRFPEGSHLARLKPEGARGAVEILTADLFAAADLQISFDGARVLFAGKKERTSLWQIWEMETDGSKKRQLTHSDFDCLRAAYLPRNEIVYTALRSDDPTLPSQLYCSTPAAIPSTSSAVGFGRAPALLHSGRFSRSA